ncbi:MaoC family dehydratase [Lentzea flaviverrucosa]|uniref:Acyl dehydratase n=1 Tax=Lentzea flaviverrucosa TaxID=200379 RepID=A0A1H9TYM4_9PSEU|nr:MaoC family dehydratase [Lentzea flaviverrucosa]RDI33413.1 acyl dehydratase [Lentzea flaviverrucosa]SES02064.1 Acyl dehydratase [Lentzea flaviverrucosa]
MIAFEDLPAGRIIPLGEVIVDRDDMLDFAKKFDPQTFHLDEEAGKNSIFGGLSASGWYTASLWMRRWVDEVLADSTSQGSPGGRELSWLAPVYPGDKLTFEAEVLTARRSKKRPDLGLVEFEGRAKRGDELVYRFIATGMFTARG